MFEKIREKKQARAAMITEMRSIHDRITTEKRSLNAEETGQIEKIEADISKLDSEIRSLEAQQRMQSTLASNDGTPPAGAEESGSRSKNPFESAEYRTAFFNKMCGRDYDQRALAVGVAAKGGNLVPVSFMKQLLADIRLFGVLRQLCTVRPLDGTTQIPLVSGHTTATWSGETDAYGETDASFDQKTLGAYKLTALAKVSEELLSDSAIDIEAFLSADFGEAFAIAEETALLAETRVHATKSPDTLMGSFEATSTAASGAMTFDDVIELFHAVKAAYRPRASFLTSDGAAKVLRKLKDSTGNYLWQNSVQAGQPDSLYGKPVNYTDQLTFAAGKTAALFGDFSRIWIADRGMMDMKRLNELYATTGQVGFIGNRRLDAVLTVPKTVAKLVVKA